MAGKPGTLAAELFQTHTLSSVLRIAVEAIGCRYSIGFGMFVLPVGEIFNTQLAHDDHETRKIANATTGATE